VEIHPSSPEAGAADGRDAGLLLLDARLKAERDYWHARLERRPEPVGLPGEEPGAAWQRVPLRLAGGDHERLEQAAAGSPFLLYALLLGGIGLCVQRYRGDGPLAVASPPLREAAGGERPNLVIVTFDVRGEMTLRQLVGSIREALLAAYEHQSYPVRRLLRELGSAGEPLPFAAVAALEGLHGEAADLGEGLRLTFRREPGALGAWIEGRVGQIALARLASHLAAALGEALRRSGRRLDDLAVLGDAELHLLRHELNPSPEAGSPTLWVLFAEQVRRTPGAVAVEQGEERLTWSELAARSARLARRLRAAGVRAETRVGLCVDRSPALIVAILAVVQAGGAYVPLDPAYPRERLELILADSGTEVLIAEERLAALLPRGDRPVLAPEAGEETSGADLDDTLGAGPDLGPDALAYVMYTSGSTGRPKGVAVAQRGIVRLVRRAEYCDLGPDQVFLLIAPVSFDASTLEIWAPLLNGGRLVLAPPGNPSPEELGALLERHGVTTLHLTAGLFHQMVESLPALKPVHQLLTGGDVVSPEAVRRALAGLPGVPVTHCYGPTESTTFTCCHRLRSVEAATAPLSIGRPIAETVVHLLDGAGRLVPVGASGELCVGGRGLARGYVAQPGWTAERFVPDPAGREPGARLYRTGDRARWRPDGTLEFLGRSDSQVKIRGYRVEPGEIEAALRACPGVEEAAVVVRGEPGDRRLVAWVAAPRGGTGAAELRAALRARMPDFMVPAAIVVEPSLPLSPNGKVDRRALARIEPVQGGAGEAPRTPLEELLAEVIAGVLGVAAVGRDDSFFDLGGHSLLATRLMSRLRRILGVELPAALPFEAPRFADLAGRIETILARGRSAGLEEIPRGGPRELSPGQEALWFLARRQAGAAAFNIAAGLRLAGRLDRAALAGGLAEVVRRHAALRSSFPLRGGLPAWEVAAAGSVSLPLVDLAGLPQPARWPEQQRLARELPGQPLDLERGPLLQACLLVAGPEEHLLLLVVHHIVSDGWSMAVLAGELTAAYRAAATGSPAALPALLVPYTDVARWQRRRLEGGALDAQVAWWRSRLAGAPALSTFPPDRPRPARGRGRGALLEVALPAELTAGVRALARSEGATVFMVLVAAFAVVLRHATGQDELVLGTDLANRGRAESEGLIGFFVNPLPLRLDLTQDPPFSGLLARVREAALGVFLHQEVPFGRVVDTLKLDRSLRIPPLYQVKLIVQSFPPAAAEAPGLTLTPVPLDSGTAQLDFVLALQEVADELRGWINFDTDLYEPATVRGLFARLEAVLTAAIARPESPLSALDGTLSRLARHDKENKEKAMKPTELSRFKSVKPKAVSLQPIEEMVETGFLREGQTLPLVVTPRVADVDPVEWAAGARDFVEAKLLRHGAVLFRGFGITSTDVFERFAANLATGLFNENGEHPRESVTGNVYTPVFYPPDQKLLWHNENSFNLSWPRKILFCCANPADTGGETPIVDSRQVYRRIDPQVRERWERLGVMYMRNYGTGLGLDWRTVFRTEERSGAEDICRRGELRWEWAPGDRLRTRAVRPGVIRLPAGGDVSWFNQAQHWHISCLDPETRHSIEAVFPEEDFPRHAYYGDGSPIPDAEMRHILDVFSELEVSFPWQKGDVILIDNVLTAHARNPFTGPRKILVALGEMTRYSGAGKAPFA
jgi:amino acid adenylation domain-containing protein